MNELTGRTLGPYQILEEIGRGGMAVVYRAYQPSLNRRVAIKVLPASLAIDPDFVQRFLHEARAAANLDHPNIVTVHDVAQQDGAYYIVMQELPGEPLSALIRREGRLPAQRASAILAQVASALDYAHSRGFVHRDVKPGNIMVGPGDRAVLTDFGIAKALAGTQLTQSGMMVGTPQYMAPEQIKGEPVSPATDIYALGIVLYEMLSGRPPFDAENITAVMYKQVHEQPPSVRTAAPALPPAVDQVLAVALSKSPAQRFPSAVAMASTLSAALAGQRVDAVAPGPATGARASTPAPVQKSSRRNWLVLGGLALVLALVVALLALAGGGPEGPPSQPPLAVAAPSATPAPAGSGAASPPASVASAPSDPAPPAGDGRPVAVSSQAVNTYTGPGREFSVQGQIEAGDPKEIIGRSADGSWLLLCCVAGDPAWVEAFLVAAPGELGAIPVMTVSAPAAASAPTASSTPTATATPTVSAVPPTPTPSASELVILASTANIRSGPGTSYPEVGQLRQGEVVAITGKNADASWWQVCCVAGQPGWTRADLGDVRGVIDGIAVVMQIPTPPVIAGRVFFASDRAGYAHVHVVSDEGGNPLPLTSGAEYYWDPVATEDGQRLAFVSKLGGNTEIFVSNADGSGQRSISSHPAVDDHPSWFPGGRELAFASDRSGSWEVYRMADNGSAVRQLTWNGGDNRFAAVSPTGNEIAYVALGSPYPVVSLIVMNSDGSNQRTIFTYESRKQRDDPGRYVFRPDWSPDGTTLAFGADDDDDSLISVVLIDSTSGTSQRLILDGNSPAWSPNGQRLVYKPAGEPQILYVADRNGSMLRQLTAASSNSWSPDWTR